jgi:hypothetical protein
MKKAIITLTIGDKFNWLATLTHPTFKKYADKVGADFHIINKRVLPDKAYIPYEKVQLSQYLDAYDRIIYIDTDALIFDNCPNLFEIVPYGWFGAFSEGNYLDRIAALKAAALQFGYNPELLRKYEKKYFNAGVMVFDKTHRFVFLAPQFFHNNFQDHNLVEYSSIYSR